MLTFNKLYTYNTWAWGEVLNSLEQLDDKVLKAEGGFFWGSLHGMAVHGLAAEVIWLERLNGNSPKALLDPNDYPDIASIRTHWQVIGPQLHKIYAAHSMENSAETMTYTSTEGTENTVNIAELLQHIINHGTEHRSQMTPVLYNEGVATVPLDFIYYCIDNS